MTREITIRRQFHVVRGSHGRKSLRAGLPPARPQPIPRLARWMALAIHMDELVRQGQASNQSELARLGHVSRARLTQIMNLVLLAPDIQEELLFLMVDDPLAARIRLRQLQPIVALVDWSQQRAAWAQLKAKALD